MNDTSAKPPSKGPSLNGTRGGGGAPGKPGSRPSSRASGEGGARSNRAALLRVAEKRRQQEAGFLGREKHPGPGVDLPPFWSTQKHGLPGASLGGSREPRGSPRKAGSRPAASSGGGGSSPKKATTRASSSNNNSILATLRLLETQESDALSPARRVKLVRSLPPHEQILALARGLDRDPNETPWTGDSIVRWRRDPDRCIRAAVASLEARMRRSLTLATRRENEKSKSPALRPRDFLLRVFQRVDKKRHGRVTGDCDVGSFMRVWSGATRAQLVDDERIDDAEIEHAEDAENVAENAAPNLEASASNDDGAGPEPSPEAASPRRKKPASLKPPRPRVSFAGGGGGGLAADAMLATGADLGASFVMRRTSGAFGGTARVRDPKFDAIALAPDPNLGALASSDDGGGGVSQSAAAALFAKYGCDREGFMPYEVFVNALLSAPSRLLGMEPIMDAKENDRHGYEDDDDFHFDGKIIYPKCRTTVFPPSEFDGENVARSRAPPEAELELEHAYGYAGVDNLAPNLFYLNTGEVVYYVAAVGVVLDKDKLEKREKCQRFFFGHDDDIKCIAMHPNREWVATGQLGRRPFVCVWDAVTCLQLQRIVHPAGMRGVIALGFSQSDGGAHLTAVNSDDGHSVFVWRWSKRGDDAAIDRAKPAPGWSFGPPKRVREKLEFYDPEDPGAFKARASALGVSATKAASKLDLAAGELNAAAAETLSDERNDALAAEMDAHADNWKFGDGTYELAGEGQGINGLPPMVYGCVWNPFPGMEEFVTYGAKHVKVWRRVDLGSEENALNRPWVGEMGLRNDGRRVADFSAKDPRTVNTGEPGGGFVPTPTPTATPGSSAPTSPNKEKPGGPSGDKNTPKVSSAVSKSMTSLSAMTTTKGAGTGKGLVAASLAGLSASVRASLAKASLDEPSVNKHQKSSSAENVLSAAYVRRNVLVTGFPDGALGVWVVTHRDASGATVADPGAPDAAPVARWSCALAQRISDAHGTGPRVTLPDGTTAFGGVRALETRPDGRTMLSGGADGWIHAWEIADGDVCVPGRPRTDGPQRSKGPPVERVRAVLLRKLARDTAETNGPNSFRFASPYANEPPPAIRSLDCRPPGIPPPGKKKPKKADKDKIPREFVFGTNRCDVWEVEYKNGEDQPPVCSVQVHGHLADLHAVATHPRDPNVFASAAEADRVFLWSAADRNLSRTAPAGLIARSIAFSADPVRKSTRFPGWQPYVMKRMGTSNKFKAEKADAGHHLAVGGKDGGIAILDGVTLQPLVTLPGPATAVDDLKYCGEPRQMLAAGSHDLVVDVYDVASGYAPLSKCRGHQSTITNLDWSLPDLDTGRRTLQSTCASYELLYWDPVTGKQIYRNQRDQEWETWTCALGFPVMGVWADGSDGTDINAVDRAYRGQKKIQLAGCAGTSKGYVPPDEPYEKKVKRLEVVRGGEVDDKGDLDATNDVYLATGNAVVDGLPGAGFLVTSDDFGKIKLFNYPCVYNDAPYREYKGHASHAMCARFSCDDGFVITAGGRDRAMFQFATRGIRPEDEPREYAPPPEPKREWGPLDDAGKSFGWIEIKEEGAEAAWGMEERRKAPEKPDAPMANVPREGVRVGDGETDPEAGEKVRGQKEGRGTTKGAKTGDDEPNEGTAGEDPEKMAVPEKMLGPNAAQPPRGGDKPRYPKLEDDDEDE